MVKFMAHPPSCSIQPLLSADELERTKHIVNEFGQSGGVGEVLQKALVQRAKTQDNWVH